MAQALKKPKIVKDEYAADGVRLFNPSKEHGVVYCDGYMEVKYIQEYEGREMHYRGDRLPVGYKAGEPLPKHADELLDENQQLRARIADLEASQRRTNELLEKLSAQLGAPKDPPAPAALTPESAKGAAPAPDLKSTEAPARGVKAPK
jgi:hypothetical protein